MLWKRKFSGLQYQLLRMILALVALPIIVISVTAYIINARYMENQVRVSQDNAISKTVTALEHVLGSLRDDSLEIFQQDVVQSYLTAESKSAAGRAQKLLSYLNNHLSYNNYIAEIHLEGINGQTVRSASVYRDLTGEQKELASQGNGRLTFVGEAEPTFTSRYQEAYVFARLLKNSINDFRDIGYMQILVPKEVFDEILGSGEENLLVCDGLVILASDPEYQGRTIRELFGGEISSDKAEGYFTAESGLRIRYSRIDQFGWYLVSRVAPRGLREGLFYNTLFWMLLALGLMLFVVCAVLARRFSTLVLRPLLFVSESMKNLEKNDYDLQIPEQGNDEITVLTRSFNKMSRRIHELLNDVYLFQIKEKEAQIKALQAYIDPHFLYNTLDTICWMSRMENAPETEQLIEALASLLRASVRADDGITNVEKELEYTRNYLMIQGCRYADSIEFQFEIEERLADCKTVNFALQPLIENAIVHGIDHRRELGHINIRVYHEEERLIYSVSDDGDRADPEELNELIRNYSSGQRGLAIAGLNTRIRLCFGEDYGLRYEKGSDGGLRAVVTQPLLREGGDDVKANDCR